MPVTTTEPVTHKPAALGHTAAKEETSRGAHTTDPKLTEPAEKETTNQS